MPAWDKVAARAYTVFALLALVAVPGFLAYIGLGVIGLLFALPLFAWVAARLLVGSGFEMFAWLSNRPLMKWQGSYYAFNDVQVRVYEADGQLWFALPDVMTAIGLSAVPDAFRATHPGDVRVVPGTRLKALNPAGLEHLLARRHEHEAMRFLTWMQREVVKPWERKKA